MKHTFTILLTAALAVSCINSNYDLSKVDDTVTILPGLTVPVKPTGDNTLRLDSGFVNAEGSHSTTTPNGTILIGRRDENSVSATVPGDFSVISLPGEVTIPCADEFARLMKGVTFSIPLNPIIEICNPTAYTMDLTATVRCGDHTKEVGPYSVPAGTTKINVTGIQEFFTPIRENIVISEMKLSRTGDTRALTRAQDNTISAYLYLPLDARQGQTITVDYPVEESYLRKTNMDKLREKYGFTLPEFLVSANITSNIPMNVSASASACIDTPDGPRQQGPYAFKDTIKAGDGSAVTTSVEVEVKVDSDALSFTQIVIHAECTPTRDFSLTTDHCITYDNLQVKFTDGITVKP